MKKSFCMKILAYAQVLLPDNSIVPFTDNTGFKVLIIKSVLLKFLNLRNFKLPVFRLHSLSNKIDADCECAPYLKQLQRVKNKPEKMALVYRFALTLCFF